MIRYGYIILLFIASISVCAQEGTKVSFDRIIDFLNQDRFILKKGDDGMDKYSVGRNESFSLSISSNPIEFTTKSITLENPFFSKDLEYEENYKNFPVSYSVIYENKLISLFDNGKFVCYNLDNFIRDNDYELKLNLKKFVGHWIIEGRLCAYSQGAVSGDLFEWDNGKWIKSDIKTPIKDRPILYDDNEFIVFGDCHGEWGGTVYFYEKATEQIYFTESTCANTIIKKDGVYLVLADLGHMSGSTEIKAIKNPRLLSKTNKNEIGRTKNGEALGYSDKSGAYKQLFDFYNVLLFSTFEYNRRQLFIAHLMDTTFLAEIKENQIQVVHPLFDDDLYTHQPVTKSYGSYTLMNLDHYGTAKDREVSMIMIKGTEIIRLNWSAGKE